MSRFWYCHAIFESLLQRDEQKVTISGRATLNTEDNVNNVLDEEYYIGYWSVNPQKPRNVVISMAYKF